MSGRDAHRAGTSEIPSLDGIRAVSVLIVFLSHSGFERWVPGGLGVTIFFFLSGFLITTLLLREHGASGRIDIPAFYLRRLFRLMPPLLVMLAIAYALTFAGILPGHITPEGLASQLFYFANYLEIFWDGSMKIPTGTGVLWSLAVEEHFYLVFPVLMALAFAKRMENRTRIGTALAVCAAVLAWRCVLIYGMGASEVRTYFASDTRIDSILYGCLLAFMLGPQLAGRDEERASMGLRDWLMLGGAGVLLLFTLVHRDPQFRETFRYSLQGLALMPIFLLAVRHHRSWIFAWLNNPIVMRIGVFSYSIYLIHRVIIVALADQMPALAARPVMLSLIAFTLSCVFAALVDRYVDGYFRRKRGAFRSSPKLSAASTAQALG